jgi:uncharacterized membrane protein YhaH (DUF805 family)
MTIDDLKTLLFGFSGRINRAKYWAALGIYFAIVVIFVVSGMVLSTVSEAALIALMIGAFIVYIPILISSVAVGIKRLHDRDKNGWWLLIFYLLPGVLSAIGEAGGGAIVFTIASFAISMWAIVELGALRGTAGTNRYGPDPLASQPTP